MERLVFNGNMELSDSKVHVASMEATWVLSAPGGPHVAPCYKGRH